MTDRLIEFLTVLDKNDELRQQYLSDKKGTAEAYGLNADDVSILVNNDVEAIKKRADAEGADMINISLAN
ncbi:MAG: hypothetical protein NWQ54_20935 [Paraglaciecola sp.]|uniref:hypothetical protein n=1 Tax=Flavobacterium sp. W21_SRS_FM6 TaxID=3240268 RepID=UPI0027510908|nr:hypothetical protein [Paraglaciecola sp.]